MSFFNLPQNETAFDLIAKSLGQGLGGGIEKGLSDSVKAFHDQKNRLEKGRPQVDKFLSALLKTQGQAYDAAAHDKARKQALELFESDPNIDPFSAALLSYQKLTSPETQPGQQTKTQGFLENLKEDVLGAGSKLARFPVERLINPLSVLARGAESGLRSLESKIKGVPEEQLIAKEQEGVPEFFKKFGETTPLQKFDIATQGRGIIPENVPGDISGNVNKAIQRVVASSTVGGLPMVGAQAAEEILKSAGFPEIAQFIGGLGGFAAVEKAGLNLGPVFERLEKQIISRIPSAKKSLDSASKVADVPKEEIIKEAAKNLEARGVNVLKAGEGDAATINELQKEVNKVSQTFQSAERQSVKELEKVRQDVAKKLPESPLEKYYAPEKEVASRPETIAKEEARIAPLQTQIKQNERRLKNLQYEILNTESAVRAGNLTPEALARVESKLALDRLQHEKTLNELRNLNFEIKYKRLPATTEQIQKQIEESFTKLREGIKNPTAEKVEAFRKGIERDRGAIATAEKLAARGEIPGKPVFDEFIKIHEQYNKAYSDLSKELGDFIKDNKAIKAKAKQVANATELKKLVDEAKKIGEAKVLNQIDKRRAIREIDRPASGAFYRQMLKDLRKDVDAFQKDFFKWKQIASPQEAKVAEKGAEAIKAGAEVKEGKALGSPQKIAEEAKEAIIKPSEENINKIAQDANASPEEVKGFLGEMKNGWKKIEDKFKKGSLKDKEIASYASTLNREIPRIKKSIRNALIVGTIQGLIEELTGFKIPLGLAGAGTAILTKGKGGTRLGTLGITTLVTHEIRDAFERYQANKLRELRNSPEFNKRVQELRERYSDAKVKRIIKRSTK